MPAEKSCRQAGGRAPEHEGLPRGHGGSLKAVVGISGWQLVKRYVGRLAAKRCEMTSTPNYRELPTGSPRVGQRYRLVRRRPCQQMTRQEE